MWIADTLDADKIVKGNGPFGRFGVDDLRAKSEQ